MNYSEKLKDPRWQRRRLEVFEAAGWKCEFCKDETSTLHVHHLKYTGEPWDAPLKSLECLCEKCHDFRTANPSLIDLSEIRAEKIARFNAALLELSGGKLSFKVVLDALESKVLEKRVCS